MPIRTAGPLASRQSDSPAIQAANYQPPAGNRSEAILARLAGISAAGQTSKIQPAAEPAADHKILLTLESAAAQYRTLRKLCAYVRENNLANAAEVECALEDARAAFHYACDAIPYDDRIYKGHGVYAKRETETPQANAGELTHTQDAGEDAAMPKKRPHCLKCDGNNVQRDGKWWTCGDCGNRGRRVDWRSTFTKSQYEMETERITLKRDRLRAAYVAGEMIRDAAKYCIYGAEKFGVKDDLADVTLEEIPARCEASMMLVELQRSCISGFTYLELDKALTDELNKLRVRWMVKVADWMQQQKHARQLRGKLTGPTHANVAALAAASIPNEVKMHRTLTRWGQAGAGMRRGMPS